MPEVLLAIVTMLVTMMPLVVLLAPTGRYWRIAQTVAIILPVIAAVRLHMHAASLHPWWYASENEIGFMTYLITFCFTSFALCMLIAVWEHWERRSQRARKTHRKKVHR